MSIGNRLVRTLLPALALGLFGCDTPKEGKEKAAASERLILCSFQPMYVATLNIAAGVPGVKVENMAGPQTGCLHDYQLTPKDMARLEKASLFVANGAGMESFLEDLLKSRKDLGVVEASRGIELLPEHSEPEGHESHEEHGHEEHGKKKDHGHEAEGHEHGAAGNPHVWVSVTGAIAQARNITEQLAALDTANAALYRKNGARYVASLDSLRLRMHAALDSIPSRDIITFHEAFPYFAKEFGLRIVDVIQREPGSEPNAAELAATVKTVKSRKVKALFAEPQYPAKAAQAVARETGIPVRILDPAVNGSDDPRSYIRAMDANLLVLREALGAK